VYCAVHFGGQTYAVVKLEAGRIVGVVRAGFSAPGYTAAVARDLAKADGVALYSKLCLPAAQFERRR
jgi:hypothetical protein